MNLKMTFEVLEHSDVGESGPSVAVEGDKMRKFLISLGIYLVHVFLAIHQHISNFKLLLKIHVGVTKCRFVNIHELFVHDWMVFMFHHFYFLIFGWNLLWLNHFDTILFHVLIIFCKNDDKSELIGHDFYFFLIADQEIGKVQ